MPRSISSTPILKTASEPPLIDLQTAIEVWQNESEYEGALQLFLDQNTDTLARLSSSIIDKDQPLAHSVAHQLKRVSGNLSLSRRHERQVKLDTPLRNTDISHGAKLIHGLQDCLQQSTLEIKKYLERKD